MALVLYVFLLAIPFVPGAEVGIALLLVFGAAAALPVYVATVVALSLSYCLGRIAFECGSSGAHLCSAATSDAAEPAYIARTHRPRWARRLMRFRWWALFVLINTPGNSFIGGGGGIAMAVGYSRTFTYPAFLACIALAVAPVPAMVVVAEQFQLNIGLDRRGPAAESILPAAPADD